MMIKTNLRKRWLSFICMVGFLFVSCITVEAAAESYNTYYSFSCSKTTRKHSASSTPTVKISTSNMKGDSSDKLWVDIEKKVWWGWSSPGSENCYKKVSSVKGSTFSLKGKGSGTYRLLFGKSSMILSGDYDLTSPKWYAKLKINYNH